MLHKSIAKQHVILQSQQKLGESTSTKRDEGGGVCHGLCKAMQANESTMYECRKQQGRLMPLHTNHWCNSLLLFLIRHFLILCFSHASVTRRSRSRAIHSVAVHNRRSERLFATRDPLFLLPPCSQIFLYLLQKITGKESGKNSRFLTCSTPNFSSRCKSLKQILHLLDDPNNSFQYTRAFLAKKKAQQLQHDVSSCRR